MSKEQKNLLQEIESKPLVCVVDKTRKANKLRGSAMRNYVASFWEKFRLGEEDSGFHLGPITISTEAFDHWLLEIGLLPYVPDPSTDRQSDQWLGHLQRRHQNASSLRRASTHPRVRDEGGMRPFDLEFGSGGVTIREVHDHIAETRPAKAVESLVKTKRDQLRYLMESADWSILPEHDRAIAEALADDIDHFAKQVAISAEHLNIKFSKLAMKLREKVAAKQIEPINGGINAVVSKRAGDHDD